MKFRFYSPKNLQFHKMNGMKKIPQQLIKQYASCPISQNEYGSDGKKFTVIRHFTGDKNINQVIYRLAQDRADREMGLK